LAESKTDRALATLLLGALGIAFAPIFVRLSPLAPTVTAFWRLALAAPILWAFVLARGARARPTWGLMVPGVFFALDLGVWHWSIHYTSVANSTLLANCAPVFVTLFGWMLFGRRFRKLFLLGMVVALGGATILMGDSFSLSRGHVLGDALGLLTAVFYASYILSVGRLRERHSTATIMAWSATTAAILLLPVSIAAGEPLFTGSFEGWWILVALALVSHVGGQGAIAYALAHLPAAFSSVTLLLQPAIATALAWILFGEALGGWQGLGAAILFAGILVARRGSR